MVESWLDASLVRRRHVLGAVGATTFLAAAAPMARAALPMPRGEILLTVRGQISVTNAPGMARLDRTLLLEAGDAELRTVTPFTDGASTFSGVLASRLLDWLGASGSEVRCRALNDYSVVIPIAELRAYPVLLALDRDGRPLSVRERGPLWVIYPWSDYPELDDRVHRQRSIWQLSELDVG